MSFRSSLKCLIINFSVFFFHRESHFWHQFLRTRGFYSGGSLFPFQNSTQYS
jgi:hypothetical protein